MKIHYFIAWIFRVGYFRQYKLGEKQMKTLIVFIPIILCLYSLAQADDCTPPTITSHPSPSSVSICYGDSYTYSVSASGTEPLSYQWQKNEVDIPGAISSSYAATEFGLYRCIVSNSCGSAINARAIRVRPRSPCDSVGQIASARAERPTVSMRSSARRTCSGVGVQCAAMSMVAVMPVSTTSRTVSGYCRRCRGFT